VSAQLGGRAKAGLLCCVCSGTRRADGDDKCRSAEQQEYQLAHAGRYSTIISHLHDIALNPFLYSSIGASAAPLLILNIV